jgi:hypothetical protein
VLRQLAHGLNALHAAGKIHRDVKPSNVLVTAAGRVVLLDFGLVVDAAEKANGRITRGLVGTPDFMSPEQKEGHALTPAADWYSLGVMLYEALMGRVPAHAGRGWCSRLAAPIRRLPADLLQLAQDLMRARPEERPNGAEVLCRLGTSDRSGRDAGTCGGSGKEPFVGREAYLQLLRDGLRAVESGRPAIVLVEGASGVGKTALVAQFLKTVSSSSLVVLEGRCYERESVPYKALDPIVDALTRWLAASDDEPLLSHLPRDTPLLARIFPVLRRVPAIAAMTDDPTALLDPHELRQRAFGALRALLADMAARRTLVLWIDDLQWTDLDSMAVLSEMLAPSEGPPLMFVASRRPDSEGPNRAVAVLLARLRTMEVTGTAVSTFELPALSLEESTALATDLIPPNRRGDIDVTTIAREAAGSPFFLRELVSYALAAVPEGSGQISVHSLEEAIWQRMSNLGSEGQAMLRVMAVSAQPVARDAIRLAAGLDDDQLAVTTLRASGLITSSGARRETLDVCHDRVRQIVLGRCPPSQQSSLHGRLADALRTLGLGDPESLAEHFEKAGRPVEARAYAARAAHEAMRALAFDRAVRLYRLTLALPPANPEDWLPLQMGLAEALVNSGRGAEAARLCLSIADRLEGVQALEYRRRAAEYLLITGHLSEGTEVLEAVLDESKLPFPRTPRAALLSFVAHRFKLRCRGLQFTERPAQPISAEAAARVDTCWAVAIGFATIDTIRAADFQTRHLLLALELGDLERIARAMALEVGFLALPGGPSRQRVGQVVGVARALAERLRSPYAQALSTLTFGLAEHLQGRWKESLDLFIEAERLLTENCVGVTWEVTTSRRYLVGALWYMGELRELFSRLRVVLALARERGNVHAETNFESRFAHIEALAQDSPAEGRRRVAEAARYWPRTVFLFPHFNELQSRAHISLYEDEATAAWELVSDGWKRLRRSQLMRIQVLRIEAFYLRGRCALGVFARSRGAPAMLREAERGSERIAREDMPWSNPLAFLLRAGVAVLEGRETRALEHLHAAEGGLARAQMHLFGAAARRKRGLLLGGTEGQQLVREAEGWMARRGVVNPAAMSKMLLGF